MSSERKVLFAAGVAFVVVLFAGAFVAGRVLRVVYEASYPGTAPAVTLASGATALPDPGARAFNPPALSAGSSTPSAAPSETATETLLVATPSATATPAPTTYTPTPALGSATRPAATARAASKALVPVADVSELDSYRADTKVRLQRADGSQLYQIASAEEWSKGAAARRIVVFDTSGVLNVEQVRVARTMWARVAGVWIQVPAAGTPELRLTIDDRLMASADQLEYAGDETVHGVLCKRYTVSGRISRSGQNASGSGTVQGEVWIANQAGLPRVFIQERLRLEGELAESLTLPGLPALGAGQTVISIWERDVFDVQAPVQITPPSDAFVLPALPPILPALPELIP